MNAKLEQRIFDQAKQTLAAIPTTRYSLVNIVGATFIMYVINSICYLRLEYTQLRKSLFGNVNLDTRSTGIDLVKLTHSQACYFIKKYGIDTPFPVPPTFIEETHQLIQHHLLEAEYDRHRRLLPYAEKVWSNWTTDKKFINCPKPLTELGSDITFHDDSEGFVLYKKDLATFLRKAMVTVSLDDM